MSAFTIFGNGNMGSAIGAILTEGGAEVAHITASDPGPATVTGDVVILAVPYPAVAGILETYAAQLDGKVVVDITNPLNFQTFDELVVPVGSSAAAEIQKALPGAKVLKAFNTNFAATLASHKVGDVATTVLVAGDDADAKSTLIEAATAGGVAAKDVGKLSRAHELEAIGFLQLTLAASGTINWTGGFALVD